MSYGPTLKILDAEDPERDVLRSIAGVAPRDIDRFLGCVAVHLAGLLNLPVSYVRGRLTFDLGDEIEAKPIGTGTRVEADLELRAVAQGFAVALVPSFPDPASRAA